MEVSISDRMGQVSGTPHNHCSQVLKLPKEEECLENYKSYTDSAFCGKLEGNREGIHVKN